MAEVKLIEMTNGAVYVETPEKFIEEYKSKGYKIVEKEGKKKADK